MSPKKILEIKNLNIGLREGKLLRPIVKSVSITSYENQITCIVGESGSGKTLITRSILGLIKKPLHRKVERISLGGQDITHLNRKNFKDVTKNQISMIFQNPESSLNPTMKIGSQLCEALLVGHRLSKSEARSRALEAMARVGINNTGLVFEKYPFQLSGGMCQRIMIAMALLQKPKLLIADEPTTALDMVIQAEILKEIYKLKFENESSILFITHDLKVVAEIADYVYVVRAGKIVEGNDVYSIFKNPKDPYTKRLINSIY